MLVGIIVYVDASVSFQICYRIPLIYLVELFVSVYFQMNL